MMFLLMSMLVILMVVMIKVAAVRSDNHVGISSFVFSNTGRGLYMSTCNELQEIRLEEGIKDFILDSHYFVNFP